MFGEPVQHGGVTVVTVARVRWGFGGGGGRSDAKAGRPRVELRRRRGVAADPIGDVKIGSDGAISARSLTGPTYSFSVGNRFEAWRSTFVAVDAWPNSPHARRV